MNKIKLFSISFIFIFILWLLLTADLSSASLIAGGVISAMISHIALPRLEILNGLRFHLASIPAMLRYLWTFSLALLKANLDLARRVLNPSLPIRPAVVRVETRLRSELGRLLLANSITLTPGTLTIDIENNELLVHWIDCPPGTDLKQATQAIVAQFEPDLMEFMH